MMLVSKKKISQVSNGKVQSTSYRKMLFLLFYITRITHYEVFPQNIQPTILSSSFGIPEAAFLLKKSNLRPGKFILHHDTVPSCTAFLVMLLLTKQQQQRCQCWNISTVLA
jgi:hypothetical protein